MRLHFHAFVLGTALVLGVGTIPSHAVQGQPTLRIEDPKPAPDEAALTAAVKISDPAARAAALRKFLADHPASQLQGAAKNALLGTLVNAKAPSADLVAVGDTLAASQPNPVVYNRLAYTLAERGEMLDKAAQYAEAALNLAGTQERYGPLVPQIKDTLGYIHLRQGHADKAIVLLAEADKGAPNQPEIMGHLAEAYAKAGKNDDAIKTLIAIREIAPGSSDTLLQLGGLYEKTGKTTEAIDAYLGALTTFSSEQEEAKAPLEALYKKANGSLKGLDERVAAARLASKKAIAFDARRYEQAAPAWELKDMAGKPVKLSDFKGKVIVMDFWGSWCPPCRAELPTFQSLYDQYKGKNVVFLGMNWEQPAEPEARMAAVRDFMANNKYTFPVVIDHDRVAVESYKLEGFPTVYMIDQTGTIRYRNLGYEEGVGKILQAQLDSMLETK